MVARPDNDQHTFLVIPLRTILAPFLTLRLSHPHHNRDRKHDRPNPPPIETINNMAVETINNMAVETIKNTAVETIKNTAVETINNTAVETITEPTTESPNTQSRKMTTGQHASILPEERKGQGEIAPTC
jgi:hypothetical protein